ncbi:MAG: TolC family protein, partial [Bacteroidaceae bacterium]|nr:TolC family protein [Bacteroidaceae bacterium]
MKKILFTVAASLMLTGCSLYKKYEAPKPAPEWDKTLFGTETPAVATQGASIAQMSWREFFSDPNLQALIDQALANNTDLNTARINIEKSQIALKTAKLAYLPSLYLTPQGTISKFGSASATKAYSLQMELSWDVDLFGSITNKKRAAKAILMQSQMSEEATRSNLISSIAQQYFYLQ